MLIILTYYQDNSGEPELKFLTAPEDQYLTSMATLVDIASQASLQGKKIKIYHSGDLECTPSLLYP
jgi:hypothetical protein